MNWSQKPNAWLASAAVAMLLSLAVIASRKSWLSRPNLLPAILFILLAALPALPLLLIGSDLGGARVLYLPSIGFSLLWMLIIKSVKSKRAAIVLGSSTLLFQLAALLHNQQIWGKLAESAKQACLDTARIQKQNPRASISVYHLPATLDGVFFFQNGFPQCVAMASGMHSAPVASAQSIRLFWNDATRRVELHHSPPQ